MYFGEFLINKKIINEEQLLDALVFQVEHLPSFLRILREEKAVSPKDIVRMIQLQLERNSDLISVLKNENKIDEKKLEQLFQKQVEKRKMLGSVLVELKMVEQPTMEKMLHEFLRDKENLPKTFNKLEISPAKVEEVKVEVEMSEAALESLRELGILTDFTKSPMNEKKENVFIDEFLNAFSEKMYNKLNKLIQILYTSAKDESDIGNYFNSFYRDLLLLRGAAQVADLNHTVSLFSEWVNVLEPKLMENNEHLKEWGARAIADFEGSLNFLWELREIISQDQGEDRLKSDSSLNERSQQFSKMIKAL